MAEEDKKYKIIRRSYELSIRLSGDSRTQILADAGFALFDLLVDPVFRGNTGKHHPRG